MSEPIDNKLCPKCETPYDPAKDQLIECPVCLVPGATSCCNPAGEGQPCSDCSETPIQEAT